MLKLISQLKFWVLLVALLYFVLKQINPDLPFTEEQLLGFIITVLTLAGVHTEVMYRRLVAQLSARGAVEERSLWGE